MSARRVTQAAIDAICERLADGESLRAICESPDMPNRGNVFRALAVNEEWQKQYALAKEAGIEALVDDIVAVATTPRIGTKTTIKGKGKTKTTETVTGDMVDRSRLEVDAKKWIVSKLAPTKYGDKLNVDLNAKVQGAVHYQANMPPRNPR